MPEYESDDALHLCIRGHPDGAGGGCSRIRLLPGVKPNSTRKPGEIFAHQAEPLLAAVAAFHDATGLADSYSTPSEQNSLQANRSPSTRHCRTWPSTTGNGFPHQAHFLNFERCDMAFSIGWPDAPAHSLRSSMAPARRDRSAGQHRTARFSRGGGSRPAKRIPVTASTSLPARRP